MSAAEQIQTDNIDNRAVVRRLEENLAKLEAESRRGGASVNAIEQVRVNNVANRAAVRRLERNLAKLAERAAAAEEAGGPWCVWAGPEGGPWSKCGGDEHETPQDARDAALMLTYTTTNNEDAELLVCRVGDDPNEGGEAWIVEERESVEPPSPAGEDDRIGEPLRRRGGKRSFGPVYKAMAAAELTPALTKQLDAAAGWRREGGKHVVTSTEALFAACGRNHATFNAYLKEHQCKCVGGVCRCEK